MKYLIAGIRSMKGHVIADYLTGKGHCTEGLSPLESQGHIKDIITSGNFDAVINCASVINQFAEADHEQAVYINSYLPHLLAKLTNGTHTQVVHISTDCIYEGNTGPYTEDTFPDGTSFYARSKALGELRDNKNITLRCSIIGPDIRPEGIGLLNWFMKQTGSIKGFSRAIWTGQTSLQLAKTIEAVTMRRASGLFNAVPETSISKYELLRLFNKHIRKSQIEIIEDPGFVSDKSLTRTNYDKLGEIPGYEEQIKELGEYMRQHHELYPHYELV